MLSRFGPRVFHYNGQGGIEVYGLYNVLGRAPNMEQDADLITAEVHHRDSPRIA